MYSRLIIEMKKRGITQDALSQHAKISKTTMWRRLKGESEFTSSEMYAICEMIPDVPMSELFVREA